QRRIYDLLVVTSETSADLLEFRLASMYQHIDYFIILETPSPAKAEDSGSSDPSAPPPSIDPPTLLDRIWTSRLSSYHAKIIRHTLSQHAYDFKHGLDHAATTRNAIFTRVIPLLTGAQKVQLGDVLLISDVEEVLRPVTTRVLRNCDIPERTTVRTRRYWYSYHEKGNEWWPHPQATVYQGADTILPDDLRKQRSLDEYVFGDGGWTCHLCYPTISETLVKLGEGGVIWHDGPRWKAAGRVVSKVMKGIDLYDRTHLARIEVNPDLPPYLQNNPHRYKWLLDRDPLGANFADF
ncbi:family 17 glycosyltransferase, partial [Cryphonectria parasitica EP155]